MYIVQYIIAQWWTIHHSKINQDIKNSKCWVNPTKDCDTDPRVLICIPDTCIHTKQVNNPASGIKARIPKLRKSSKVGSSGRNSFQVTPSGDWGSHEWMSDETFPPLKTLDPVEQNQLLGNNQIASNTIQIKWTPSSCFCYTFDMRSAWRTLVFGVL